MSIYCKLGKLLNEGGDTALITVTGAEPGSSDYGRRIIYHNGRLCFSELENAVTSEILEAISSRLEIKDSALVRSNGKELPVDELFIHFFNARPRLIIFGGGHVGGALSRIASHLDFEIILIDDRPAFANQAIHPNADRVICDNFERAFNLIEPRHNDFLVIVTRGHRHDRLCLEQALNRDSSYVGMIGSKSRVRAQLAGLAEAGFPKELLDKVHSPIGLSIGAVTESEIAISILAEIIQVRRASNQNEAFQREVLDALISVEQSGAEAVLATVIRATGSTPRKAGAQMLIYPDGSTIGTIGGGCAEAEVRREALLCFEEKGSSRMQFSLTADTAADEGMACGGNLSVFLEVLAPRHQGKVEQ